VTEKSRIEQYLELAHEAEKLAAEAPDVEGTTHWAKIAAGYRQLAQAALDNAIIGETSDRSGRSDSGKPLLRDPSEDEA